MTPALRGALLVINLPLVLIGAHAARFYAVNGPTDRLVSGGEPREYVLHVPAGLPSRPMPLVISLHGAALWGAAQRDISRWNAVADREGFVVAYPSGAGRAAPRIWRAGTGDASETSRDVRFIADMIDSVASRYPIDRRRVYVNGFSNGGGMTFALSCQLPDRIAAVGLLGAAQTLPWRWCRDTLPMPAIVFHGTADPAMPYGGGKAWVGPRPFPAVESWVARWARRNGCAPVPSETRVTSDVLRREYANCGDGASVVLYAIEGGGHTWPGGGEVPKWLSGRPTTSINASEEMWRFFRRFRQRPAPFSPPP
jgi:polyhydroxybutyrate depolymerase